MRKSIAFTIIVLALFTGCSKTSTTPPEAIPSVQITIDDVLLNNKIATISASVSQSSKIVSKVDFYIDGLLAKTIFSAPYQFSILLKDLNTGVHKISTSVTFSNNETITTEKNANFKVNLGDDYQGGIIIKLSDNLLNGLIASKFDLAGGLLGMYSYGAYNGNYGAFSMDDGYLNSNKFEGKFDSDYAALACLKLEYNGYSDWYLPALNELILFENYRALLNIPERGGKTYWSSTGSETNTKSAYSHSFGGDLGQPCDMQRGYYVRPIRKF